MRVLAHRDRRRAAGIHQYQRAAGLDPLVAGMRRAGERRAARIVVGQHGGEDVGRGRTHAVEQREIAVAVPEEAQHRHHAVDGVEQRRRRRDVARREDRAQRQEIGHQFEQRAGIAADMPAVRQDLALQLLGEPLGGGADVALLPRHAERSGEERDHHLKARHAVARIGHRMPQVAHLPGQAAHEAAIEPRVGFVEQQRRLAEPRHHAARHHVGPPDDRIVRAVERDPLVDQGAGVGARDGEFGGAQMQQPAEAVQRDRPIFRRRRALERRARIAHHHLAGEREAAGVDFARPG